MFDISTEWFVVGAAFTLLWWAVIAIFVFPKKKPLATVIPGALPFIGHLHLLGIDLGKILPKLYEWSDKYGGKDGLFEFNIHLGRLLVVCSEERLLELLKYRPFKVRRDPTLSEGLRSIGADGLVTAEGQCWGNQRRIISPALNKKNVEDYLGNMKMVAGRLVDNWENKTLSGSTVAINDSVFAMMADILSIAGYGCDFDLINKEDSLLAQDVLNLLTASIYRTMSPVRFWRIPLIGQYLDFAGFRKRRVEKLIGSYVDEYTSKQDSLSDAQKRTFLGKLLENMKDSSSKISRKDVMGNLITLFLAGTDTNTQAIMWCLYKIASDETNLQQQLFEEMKNFDLQSCSFADLSTRLPRLKSCMHEVHRFYAGFPVVILEAIEEIQLAGKTIPPQTPFLVLMRYPSISPTNPSKDVPVGPQGEPPCEFCPRRWLSTSESDVVSCLSPNATTNSAAFMAFGVGQRACPGRLYSEAMTIITLVNILQRFQISLEENHEPVYPVFMHIDTVNCQIKLKLEKREERKDEV